MWINVIENVFKKCFELHLDIKYVQKQIYRVILLDESFI